MDKKSQGQITIKAAETLSGYYATRGYDVLYDHGSTKDHIGKIASRFGDTQGRDMELSQPDIAIVEKGSNQVFALLEIEEANDDPKTLIGDLFGILLGDHISFRGERELTVGGHTSLIVLGKSMAPHRKRNEYLRDQAMNIKSGLSTGNSVIGNIVIETFADERGLYALLSTLLGKVLK
jgi:hypothetical protein